MSSRGVKVVSKNVSKVLKLGQRMFRPAGLLQGVAGYHPVIDLIAKVLRVVLLTLYSRAFCENTYKSQKGFYQGVSSYITDIEVYLRIDNLGPMLGERCDGAVQPPIRDMHEW